MKRKFCALIFAPFVLCLSASTIAAQDEARVIWQVTNYDINANIQDRSLNAVANITARNVGRGTGTTLTLRINSKASIKTITSGTANVTFRAVPEAQGNIQRVTTTLPSQVASNGTATLNVNYSLPIDSNTGLAAISLNGSQFLPLSFWYPIPNTPFTARGADTSPFRLTVNGPGVISSGVEKSAGVFEQSLNAQPFFLQGDWDRVDGSAEARGITAYVPKGIGPEERKQTETLIAAVAAARSYLGTLLGPAPDVPFRLVSVRRGGGFHDGGTVLLDRSAFRRPKIDSATALLIGEAVAQLWVGGQTAVRGDGGGPIKEGLTRFLATLFIEKHFGKEVANAELFRQRLAFTAVAKRDGPLSRSTALDDAYFSSVPNKGAMVWRLVDNRLGRELFMTTLKSQLQSGKETDSGITLAAFRSAIVEKGGDRIKATLDLLLDQVTDTDLMIGLPQQRGAEWTAALRNLGSSEATVRVVATTDRGEQLSSESTIPARGFGEAVFKTNARLLRAEVDPDKLYPQLDFSNDTAPRTRGVTEAAGDAARLLSSQDYNKAEAVARELLGSTPQMQEARVLLARALLAQNKLEEAEKLFRTALDDPLPTPSSMAWASIGLGLISAQKGQPAEAVRRFNEAVRIEGDYPTSVLARFERIKAEQTTNAAPPIDEAAKSFVTQLDSAISSAKRPELEARVVSGELVRFVSSMVGTITWQTRVLRTELIDANTMMVDVAIQAKDLGQDRSGTAVLVLSKVGGSWKLASIELFEVR